MKIQRTVWGAVMAGALLSMCGGRAEAQFSPGGSPSTAQPPAFPSPIGSDPRIPPVPTSVQEKMEAARTEERQRRLAADTQKLLDLATRLRADVDKADKNTLSMEVVRTTAEIQRLAKSIADREKE